jgi:hypothetical protein
MPSNRPMRFVFSCLLVMLVSGAARAGAAAAHDGSHDFDFQIGTWNIQPSGDIHIVRQLWNGRASVAELEITHPKPHFAGSLLRLYDPQSGSS